MVSTLQLYFIINVPKTSDEFEMPYISFQEHIYIQYIRECLKIASVWHSSSGPGESQTSHDQKLVQPELNIVKQTEEKKKILSIILDSLNKNSTLCMLSFSSILK